MLGTTWSIITVSHKWLELETGISGFVSSWEIDSFRCSWTAPNNVEVEAVGVDLNFTAETVGFELLHITMQSNVLGSQDVCSCLDVAGKLNFVAVAIVWSNLICPFICAYQCILGYGVFYHLTDGGIKSFFPDLEEFHLLGWRVWGWKVAQVSKNWAIVHASDWSPE
jgi:hypothetical protein